MKRKMYEYVTCQDGFSVSIQGNATGYCTPRDNEGPYIEVELGFPNRVDELIMKYAEDPNNPCDTVYGYVPSEVVLEMILKHGGMVSGDMPPMVVGYSSNFPKPYDGNR
tara:strand:+ start:364 stop:690 length:327 start_codon:yes stop_codon:yes gene_type:complete